MIKKLDPKIQCISSVIEFIYFPLGFNPARRYLPLGCCWVFGYVGDSAVIGSLLKS